MPPVTLARVAATIPEVIPDNTIPVLDHGFVRLDDAMASDLSVVNGARVSFARRMDEMDESDAGLIRFLMRERHGTPFEHNAFRFHVRARSSSRASGSGTASARSTSSRCATRRRPTSSTCRSPRTCARRSASPARTRSSRSTPSSPRQTREELKAVYEAAYATYERLVEQGVARELARTVLPVGAYTEFYWTVNARSLMNFVSLRGAETAQREIRRYAEACERFLAEQMPVTYAAFVANDRTAP